MVPSTDDTAAAPSTEGKALPSAPRPYNLSHVVLQTPAKNFAMMTKYYLDFLDAKVAWSNPMLAFLAYDDEHHRIAIFAMPGTVPRPEGAPIAGLAHVAFTFRTLRELVDAYTARKARGITPHWCVNHGPTTSMYYRDPDGNEIEAQVWNFDRNEDVDEFLECDEFKSNPIGADFDPEELVSRLDAGEDERTIKKRPEIGQRLMP